MVVHPTIESYGVEYNSHDKIDVNDGNFPRGTKKLINDDDVWYCEFKALKLNGYLLQFTKARMKKLNENEKELFIVQSMSHIFS